MITLQEEKEIVRYLLSKNLNRDLFIEIKDHFTEQISILMDEESIIFEKAFTKTQQSWSRELEIVRADFFSFRKITRIEREIVQRRFRSITICALAFSLIFSTLIFSNTDLFMYIEISLLGIMAVLLGYNFIFRKMRLYHYMQLSFHPLILKNVALGIVLFSSLYFLYDGLTPIGSGMMKAFFLYAMAAKIQLLYFKAKKTNVLI
ncbi:hypothetical protein [Chryseobacterium sp. JK1]|uniref:hypothetical protein n=1 Tax=Chryseobacterium sp. JK1 TaxID=874294 RepID=UPI003D6936BA